MAWERAKEVVELSGWWSVRDHVVARVKSEAVWVGCNTKDDGAHVGEDEGDEARPGDKHTREHPSTFDGLPSHLAHKHALPQSCPGTTHQPGDSPTSSPALDWAESTR